MARDHPCSAGAGVRVNHERNAIPASQNGWLSVLRDCAGRGLIPSFRWLLHLPEGESNPTRLGTRTPLHIGVYCRSPALPSAPPHMEDADPVTG